jgi:hypothetical protein
MVLFRVVEHSGTCAEHPGSPLPFSPYLLERELGATVTCITETRKVCKMFCTFHRRGYLQTNELMLRYIELF